jgi:hypothetical protein
MTVAPGCVHACFADSSFMQLVPPQQVAVCRSCTDHALRLVMLLVES